MLLIRAKVASFVEAERDEGRKGRAINDIKILQDDARVQIPVTEVGNYVGGGKVETSGRQSVLVS